MWFPRSRRRVAGSIEVVSGPTVAATEIAGPGAAASVHAEGFRPDVEGLRGIAIVLVLLFHAALPIPGGFIGVDVFFVISGFLITGMLLREVMRSGTIALDRFFARRIRRLLPAALMVVAVTLPLTYLLMAPLDRAQAMNDGVSAVLSVSNIRFALAEGDYFSAVNGPSPFLHFWSLSLEEQFYLFWPLLLLAVARHGRVRLRAALALGFLLVASLVASMLLTEMSAAWAFYSLPTRAWQFAAGGLLAIGLGFVGRIPSAVLSVAGWVGVGLLVGCALLLDGSLPYPGAVAIVPTAAAVLLIASGERRWGPGRLLATTPLRFLGRISYSLYLWHWPILVLPAAVLGAALEPTTAVALLGASIVVAWVSWRFVETPFQHPMAKSPWAPRRSLAFGAVAMAMVVALGGTLDTAAVRAMSDGTGPDLAAAVDMVALADDLGPVVSADGTEDGELLPAATVTPEPSSRAGMPTPGTRAPGPPSATPSLATTAPTTAPTTPSHAPVPPAAWSLSIPKDAPEGPIRLPKNARPSLTDARGDIERLFADGCVTQTSGTRPAKCVYGDRRGSLTIALVGDSHASHWFPAFNVLANQNGWRLLPYVKVSCPFVDMPVFNLLTNQEYPECATWRSRVIATLNDEEPDLVVVVSGYRAIIATRHADADPKRQGQAMARAITQLKAPVVVMIDSPRASYDIPACLSQHRDDVRACAIPRAQAFPDQFGVREQIAAETTGAGLLDMVAAICPATPCQVARDGMILYRDNHHLTATFVRSLAGKLDVALAPFLPGAEPPAVTPTSTPDPTTR